MPRIPHGSSRAASGRVRDVGVALTYDHWPTNGSTSQGTGNTYGFSVSVPLFLGNRHEGEVARAEVDWLSAQDALYKATADGIGRPRAHTHQTLDMASERTARYDRELMDAARQVADAQEFAYRKGAIGVLDLLDARRTLRSIQLDAATTQADYAKALAAYTEARVTTLQDAP